MAKYYTNTEELELIADAIREKGGTNAQLTFPNEFVSAIENLPTSGGTVITGNNVIFYDYDGTIVASYSASAFAQLSQLPANPTHAGLVAQGWNWSLNDAKTFVAAHPNDQLNIGQMYITESGNTEIDVIMQEGRLEPILTIRVNGTITVDWGDETTPDTVKGTSLNTRQDVPHTYAQAGAYTISIGAQGNNRYSLYCTNSYTLLRKNTTENENKVYTNTIQHIRIGSNAEINNCAFYGCYSLSSITIPNSITSIGASAFDDCRSILSITIPNSVTSIGDNAFYGCSSLSSIMIPSDITSIPDKTFYCCYSLSGVTIPNNVTSIGKHAFYCDYHLSHITLSNSVTSIGNNAFDSCNSLASFTIPNGVTNIEKNMFRNCYSLASMTITDNVTSIGDNAFLYCGGMKEYHILPTTPPTAGTTIFNSIPNDCIIYVPAASLETYKTTTNWSNYASYMQGE